MSLAQRGDAEALGKLFNLHYLAVLRYFCSKVDNRQYAEDLTGDVFRRMLAGLPRYQSMGLPFRTWLFRIAHNTLIDHYRQESYRMSYTIRETDRPSQRQDDPAAEIEHKMTIQCAHRVMAELDPSQRDVLTPRFLSGLSVKETALTLSKTEDAIKALQRQGLAALRISLAKDLGG